MIKQLIKKLFKPKKEQQLKEGTVKFFNKSKGFGFINIKGTDEDVFVHTTNLIDKIKDNDKVIFDVEKGEKGLSAIKVRLA